ncbi:MAG: DNA translocase FtsK [Planctomycetota bacterium]
MIESDDRIVERQSDPRPDAASGLEVIGGALFLVGCLPAAAVAKALYDGTDLASEGLGGTAALAQMVSSWVGPWPALVTALVITGIGTAMLLGKLRAAPYRLVAGTVVAGLGLAALSSAIAPGSGGSLGDGTGGALAAALGSWAGILLGLGVVAAAVWLAFVAEPGTQAEAAPSAAERHEEPAEVPRNRPGALEGAATFISSLFARTTARKPRVAARVRRQGDPQTIGDALVLDDIEGVSHDEAAALAPDDKTLAYMEEVWRRASASYQQAAPVPPSPYPEDVRLKGEIPPGTQPFVPPGLDADASPAPPDAPGPFDETPRPVEAPTFLDATLDDVAPFDFDEAPAGTVGALSGEDARALEEAVLREGADPSAPSELPPGVRPLVAETPDLAPEALAEEAPVSPIRPPASWETMDDELDAEAVEVEPEPIPDVDEGGHWPRRDAEESAESDEVEVEAEVAVEEDEDVDLEEEGVVDAEDVEETDEDEDVEYEYYDEDGNPIDPEDLDEEYEEVDGDDEEDEEVEYELVDAEDDEYEVVDGEEDDEELEPEEETEDVVLEPAAPPEGATRDASPLHRAGLIVVREGRVAVSVLQKQLEMEFDEACELLDRLQDEGLIGPYRGGKKREILLSEEEWEERFATS